MVLKRWHRGEPKIIVSSAGRPSERESFAVRTQIEKAASSAGWIHFRPDIAR